MSDPTAQFQDHDGQDVVVQVLELSDRVEFLALHSKAKDRDRQMLRALKKLRDYLNTCGLSSFVVDDREGK